MTLEFGMCQVWNIRVGLGTQGLVSGRGRLGDHDTLICQVMAGGGGGVSHL